MLRFDDQFPIHRKVSGLSDAAFRLHVEAIFWCARNLTDGFIATQDLGSVSRYRKPEPYLSECVERDAWHRVEDQRLVADCAECAARYPVLNGDGWVVHGYLDWQQTRSKVLEIRELRKKAGQLGGTRSGETRRAGKSTGQTQRPRQDRSKREATAKQDAESRLEPPNHPSSSKGVRDARAAPLGATRVPTDPVPDGPSNNGRPVPPPADLLAEARTKARAASAKARAGRNQREQRGLDALRDATPDVPIPTDRDPPTSTPVTSEPVEEPEDPTDDQENPHAAPAA